MTKTPPLFIGKPPDREPSGDINDLFESIAHGWDGDQYFSGCGVAFSDFEHAATGRGYTPREALADALETVASDEAAPTEKQLDAIEAAILAGSADHGVTDGIWDEGACDPDDPCCDQPNANEDDVKLHTHDPVKRCRHGVLFSEHCTACGERQHQEHFPPPSRTDAGAVINSDDSDDSDDGDADNGDGACCKNCDCGCHNSEWAYRISIRWGRR